MEDNVYQAALAGLLHDVGKFMWRARQTSLNEKWSKADIREKYGYWHALASDQFVQSFIHENLRRNLSGVRYHHRPDSKDLPPEDLQPWIVRVADQLAAAEREDDEDAFIPRMESIFCHLDGHQAKAYLPLKPLDPRQPDHLFPEQQDESIKEKDQQYIEEYERLWEQLEQACTKSGLAGITDSHRALETVFSLLQTYTWCVPSAAWRSVPDISLYDHARATAAIAACLAADKFSKPELETIGSSGRPVCLLVAADLSGLQKFIYNLASEGAAKSLRARSFYVQLLSEVLALSLLRTLKLPLTNLIYVGGGGFQLLAPLNAEEPLKQEARRLTDKLLELHQGELGLALIWDTLTGEDFHHFSHARERSGKKLNRKKRQPFASASPEVLASAIGEPLTQGGDPLKFCAVTGEDGENIVQDPDNPDRYRSHFVASLEELGRLLPRTESLVLASIKEAPAKRAASWVQALEAFGWNVAVVRQGESFPKVSLQEGEFARVWSLSPPPSDKTEHTHPQPEADRVYSYHPFARLTPLVRSGNGDERPKTFDELAREPVHGSFKRWGVLRMDVDNLGKLFDQGFGEQASLSRISSLSFALRLFFEGWLPELAKGKTGSDTPITERDLRDHLYIQYSGGDDVFVVGSWDALPEFARRVRQSFQAYTAGNPRLTLSAGMTIAEEKFPLYQAAEHAGDAEDDAKNWRVEKDAFCFFSMPLTWSDFAQVQQQAARLANMVENRQLSHSVLQTLLILQEMKQRASQKGKLVFGRWMWMSAYQLTRVILGLKDQETIQEMEALRKQFITPDENLTKIGLAARWAQLWTRGA